MPSSKYFIDAQNNLLEILSAFFNGEQNKLIYLLANSPLSNLNFAREKGLDKDLLIFYSSVFLVFKKIANFKQKKIEKEVSDKLIGFKELPEAPEESFGQALIDSMQKLEIIKANKANNWIQVLQTQAVRKSMYGLNYISSSHENYWKLKDKFAVWSQDLSNSSTSLPTGAISIADSLSYLDSISDGDDVSIPGNPLFAICANLNTLQRPVDQKSPDELDNSFFKNDLMFDTDLPGQIIDDIKMSIFFKLKKYHLKLTFYTTGSN